MSSLPHDLRFALRQMRRRPAFTAVAVMTLALGIGANTAIFSVAHGVLIRPLPYAEPDRLVRIQGYDARTGPDEAGPISLVNFLDWQEIATSFEGIAAYNEWRVTLTDGEGTERLEGAEVTPEFFRVLGIRPGLGRLLADDDAAEEGGSVVLDHGFWVRRFGADPAVLGRSLVLDDESYTVIGITEAGFEDPELSNFDRPLLWRVTPRVLRRAELPRDARQFTGIGRLAPGVSLERARSEMDGIMARLAERHPEAVTDRRVRLTSLHEEMTAEVRPALLVLLAAVGFVLLIACVNVANLLITRAAGRVRELAVRASLGASRWRLGRQLVTESLALGVLGGAAGLLLAVLGTDAILALGGEDLPRVAGIGFGAPVLLFTLGVSLLAGLLAGLAPMVRLSATELRGGLGEGRRATGGPGRTRLQPALVGAEVALAVMLLVGAGLLIRSLATLQSENPGFEPRGILAVELAPAQRDYPEHPQIEALHAALHARLGSLPGVESVASVSILPMGDNYIGFGFVIEGRPSPSGPPPSESIRSATPGYFRSLGIPLVRGRGFRDSDRRDASPVIVITESMARRYWPDGDALGARITMRDRSWEIVGIAGDVRHSALGETPSPAMYVPFAQSPDAWMNRNAALVIRTRSDPAGSVASTREAIRSVDANVPIVSLRPLKDLVASTTASERFRTFLLTLFAAAALLLAMIGIYGVVAHGIVQRTRELAIRVALGAHPAEIRTMLLKQGMVPVLAGIGVGMAGALAIGGALSGLLYGVSPRDPVTLVAVPPVLAAVALLASHVPARRALRMDPAGALRAE